MHRAVEMVFMLAVGVPSNPEICSPTPLQRTRLRRFPNKPPHRQRKHHFRPARNDQVNADEQPDDPERGARPVHPHQNAQQQSNNPVRERPAPVRKPEAQGRHDAEDAGHGEVSGQKQRDH